MKELFLLEEFIREVLSEALSAKVKKSLDKKAEKRGFTKGSVYKEFEKGLAAYASSGSRKGMTAHQWAHARVNSATPSKPWACVKKSKAKKKKQSLYFFYIMIYHINASFIYQNFVYYAVFNRLIFI